MGLRSLRNIRETGPAAGIRGGSSNLRYQNVDAPDAAFAFAPTIQQSGNNFRVDPTFDIRARANITVAKTYWLDTVNGLDANPGTEAQPKKTWNAIIGTGDYDRIIIKNGSYLVRSESSLAPSRNVEVIGEGTVYFTAYRPVGAWSLSAGQTNTYQASVTGGEFVATVFDEGVLVDQLPTRYTEKTSIAAVEAAAGSYYWAAGVLYVHTLNHASPAGNTNIKFYDSSAVFWSRNNIFYFENINFRGGFTIRNASSAGGAKCYIKGCNFHKIVVAGIDEFIIQNSTQHSSNDDGINYDALNTLTTKFIEISCDFGRGGLNSTNQASTGHNGCVGVSIMGKYRNVTGQCIADAGAASRRWILGSELYASASNIGAYTEGVSWIDSAYIHNVTTDLQIVGTTYTRNLRSGGVFIGTPTPY